MKQSKQIIKKSSDEHQPSMHHKTTASKQTKPIRISKQSRQQSKAKT